MSARAVIPGILAVALMGCAKAPPQDPIERLTADLSRQAGQPVDVNAIKRKRLEGHDVACGYYGAPPAKGQRGPGLSGTFAVVDGQLLADDSEAFKPLVEACMQAFPRVPAVS
ncbi:MAG TPA: hypothetical protein VF495_03830 [Phenylobacterium sp.]